MPPVANGRPLRVVGQRLARIDGPDKVSGQALFAADVRLPGMVWGKLLRSPHPYARIRSINVEAARRLPGVLAVITAADMPYVLVGRQLKDMPVLARDVVRFVGERVAAVAAEDRDVAEEALKLIEVDYEELEPLLDPFEAIKPGAPLLHPDLATYQNLPRNLPPDVPNIHCYMERRRGDLDAGFAEADLIVDSRYTSARMHQSYMEPNACAVSIDAHGRVHVWTSNKSPHTLRPHIAEALGVPIEQTVVELVRVGGDFGAKGGLMDIPVAYYLARATRRPVRMVTTYNEEFIAGTPRHPTTITLKTGVKRDGSITAHHAVTVFDSGAYGGFKPVPGVVLGGGVKTGGCYRMPNVLLQAYIAYTNHLPGGHMRAPGDPQATFAVESHFDTVAEKLGIDPLVFRRQNVIQPGDLSPGGDEWHDLLTSEVMEAAISASAWVQPKGRYVGRGMAVINRHQGVGETQVLVTLLPDGTVQLTTGAPDAGQGVHTVLKQIAAEVLTIPFEQVTVVLGNTDETPFDPGLGASRHTHIAGQATYQGATELAERLRSALADEMGCDASTIRLEDARFFLDGRAPVPFREAARLAVSANGGPVEILANYSKMHAEQECFIAQVVTVEVDYQTGAYKVLDVVTAQDTGQLINPIGAEGQIEGGVVQGLGFATMEEMQVEDGRVRTVNFGDYKIPTIADVPPLKMVFLDAVGPGPYSAKSLAEHSLIPTAGAVGNAVYDAVGVRITSTPITPEKVYRALRERERATAS